MRLSDLREGGTYISKGKGMRKGRRVQAIERIIGPPGQPTRWRLAPLEEEGKTTFISESNLLSSYIPAPGADAQKAKRGSPIPPRVTDDPELRKLLTLLNETVQSLHSYLTDRSKPKR